MKRFPAALILIIALILTCLPVTAETTGLTITGSLELEYANQFSVTKLRAFLPFPKALRPRTGCPRI